MRFYPSLRSLDLQTKIVLILVSVLFPVTLLVSIVQSHLTSPLLNEEMKAQGLLFAQSLAEQIENKKIFSKPNFTAELEDRIQRQIYFQPSIARVDVFLKDRQQVKLIASSVEEDESLHPVLEQLYTKIEAHTSKETVSGRSDQWVYWSIYYPFKASGMNANIRVLVSLRVVETIRSTLFRFNLISAIVSTAFLILILSFLLRRAFYNEYQLKVAQSTNEELSERLQEIQRELIRKEKLAVMGQLTAQFAHEIGTPLNAVSGHLQLLGLDLQKNPQERIEVISSQVKKIEKIVKSFLDSTHQSAHTSTSEKRVVASIHDIIDRTLILVLPTLHKHHISILKDYQAKDAQIEVLPVEIEQVMLNLVNNAIDSMRDSHEAHHQLRVHTFNSPVVASSSTEEPQQGNLQSLPQNWVCVQVEDTGAGIEIENLKRIFKPFFTTKAIGEGHGLGLSICQQIIKSYGGEIKLEPRAPHGVVVSLKLPAFKEVAHQRPTQQDRQEHEVRG